MEAGAARICFFGTRSIQRDVGEIGEPNWNESLPLSSSPQSSPVLKSIADSLEGADDARQDVEQMSADSLEIAHIESDYGGLRAAQRRILIPDQLGDDLIRVLADPAAIVQEPSRRLLVGRRPDTSCTAE